MDNEAHVSAKYAVEVIFSVYRITLVTSFAQAVKIASIIPASRLLAEVTTDGALVTELRAGDFRGSLS